MSEQDLTPKGAPSVIVRFVLADCERLTASPTEWNDCIPPREGDATAIIIDGKMAPVVCRGAAITWERNPCAEGHIQVFTVRCQVKS